MKKILLCAALFGAFFVAIANAKAYEIDKSHTNIGFKIKHLAISTVAGNFKDYSGKIDFDPATFTFKSFDGSVKIASINTENKSRDAHLQEDDFFKAKKYPDLTFKMKKYQKIDDKSGKMTGTLTMLGVKKDITLDAQIGGLAEVNGKEKVGFSLKGLIKRSDFKLAPGTKSIGDEVEILIDMEAEAK